MAIKITCPHCKRGMLVDERLAGKKGRCKACQQIITVPSPAAPQPEPAKSDKAASPPGIAPPVAPADVEAAAAALFADEPKAPEPVDTRSIDLNCPFCDEAIHFSADLAGKRAPCPECKRVIKVPELVKQDPKDWRQAAARGPSGARLPEQPALEGAWGSAKASAVGQQTLVQAGVIPKTKPPRTRWQKARWPVLGLGVVLLLGVGVVFGFRWWHQAAEGRALKDALAYETTAPADAKAALAIGVGDYYRRTQKPGYAKKAGEQYQAALQSAPKESDRGALLFDVALKRIELGGSKIEVDQGMRLPWDETHKMLLATLREIDPPEAQRDALRAVSAVLLARGEGKRVLPLTNQLYGKDDADKAAALAVVGLELFQSGDKAGAETAADAALKSTGDKTPPRAEVVALATLLSKKFPEPGDDEDAEANEHLGKVEALARQKEWEQARQKARLNDFGDDVQVRAHLAVAAAAVDEKAADVAAIVEDAIQTVESKGCQKPDLTWALLRLTRLALQVQVAEPRRAALVTCIEDRKLRGWGQLLLFRARLASARDTTIEDGDVDKIEANTVARLLAVEAMAQHNTRRDFGWAAKVQGWEQPQRAFGSLGIALGLQEQGK